MNRKEKGHDKNKTDDGHSKHDEILRGDRRQQRKEQERKIEKKGKTTTRERERGGGGYTIQSKHKGSRRQTQAGLEAPQLA